MYDLLVTTVLPEFFVLFDSLENLPVSTHFLIWVSNHLAANGIFLLLHVPDIGSLVKMVYTARFSRTMSALYANGVPLVQAVFLDMCEGVPLSLGIKKVDGVDESLSVNIFIGEETGELPQLMIQMADRLHGI